MLESLFQLKKYNTTVRKEVLAGITTFLSSCYIVIINPQILGHTGMSVDALVTATVLLTFVSTIIMGLYANNPIVIAPGMGLNTFFTFTLCLGMKVPWQTALGTLFWSGLFFLLFSLTNLKSALMKTVPLSLRCSISGGIGLYMALIGFSNAGLIVSHKETIIAQQKMNPELWTFIASLFISVILVTKKIKGSYLIGIITSTALTYPLGRWWGNNIILSFKGFFRNPDFSLIGQFHLVESLKLSFFPIILTFLLTDIFDSFSTFIGLSESGALSDEKGNPKDIKRSLIADSFGTLFAGFFGTSSGTSYLESATGIFQGGKTGLVAITTALLFLPLMFLSPLIAIIPSISTAPLLIIVGAHMIVPIKNINWKNLEEGFPCFLSLTLIPLTYSITHGMVWSFLTYSVLRMFGGAKREVPLTLLTISLFLALCLFQ